MNKVLIDTNIILDIALERRPFFKDATDLFKELENKEISSFVTATTITDIYYILRKSKSHSDIIAFLRDFFEYIEIAGVDKHIIINALNSNIKDFEDAVQIESAIGQNIRTVITRNKDDFKKSGLKIYYPTEFIMLLMKK